jgi:hypothetical protein
MSYKGVVEDKAVTQVTLPVDVKEQKFLESLDALQEKGPRMAASSRKRRRKGSLAAVRTGLFTMFTRHLELVEETEDLEVITRSSAVAVQVALAYVRVCELLDVETDMQRFEHVLNGKGPHP